MRMCYNATMNEKRKERCHRIAKTLQSLRTGKSFHVAFILDKNKLLCYAINNYQKMHLAHKFGNYVPYKSPKGNYIAGRHAESEAIRLYINKFGNNDMSGLTLYVIRLSSTGELMNSEPCHNCKKNIIEPNNFKEVLWS
jgi:tRNA(Arg) A34 adenosine deaminase TadA